MAITHAEKFEWQQDVLANPQLTPTQKNVLTRLALHHNVKTGRCDPSVETLAAGAGVAKRTVQNTLARAEAIGLIKRALGGGRTLTNSYSLILPQEKTMHCAAPFSAERVHDETPFETERVQPEVENPAPWCTRT
jgi:DNA-binding transcriptional regulator YhcF (GntR family)